VRGLTRFVGHVSEREPPPRLSLSWIEIPDRHNHPSTDTHALAKTLVKLSTSDLASASSSNSARVKMGDSTAADIVSRLSPFQRRSRC
jgi:hypothetical protein